MTILTYWLCFRVPKGFLWSLGIVVLVMLLSPVVAFILSYFYEQWISAEVGRAISLEKVARGFAMGFWMWVFAPIIVWRGRARRAREDALAWKYK